MNARVWLDRFQQGQYTRYLPRGEAGGSRVVDGIRDCPKRVGCFLIIVPSMGDGAARMAARLKIESGTDTDVALITVENLLWVSEHWSEEANGRSFNPEVFKHHGASGPGDAAGEDAVVRVMRWRMVVI